MSNFIKPGSFDTVIVAVAVTAQWQSSTEAYATPSMALKMSITSGNQRPTRPQGP